MLTFGYVATVALSPTFKCDLYTLKHFAHGSGVKVGVIEGVGAGLLVAARSVSVGMGVDRVNVGISVIEEVLVGVNVG